MNEQENIMNADEAAVQAQEPEVPEAVEQPAPAATPDKVRAVLAEVNKVILGKNDVIAKVLMAILAQGHVLLDDVPGTGKTTMALAFSRALGLDYHRIQFTSDTMPSDIVGFSVYSRETGTLEYKPGVVMTNLLLGDEINRTSSKTQSALLEAMEEKHVTIDGVTRELPAPFVVLATQNPVGSAGTQMLPNSQLDRFIIKLSMGYPDVESTMQILKGRHAANPLDDVEPVFTREELLGLIDQTAHVHVSDAVYSYIAQLVEETRHEECVELGVSPRGALALTRMAQASAFVSGRDFVTPDDVLAVLPDVCSHRLILNAKARLSEQTAEGILAGIAARVPVPQGGVGNPINQ